MYVQRQGLHLRLHSVSAEIEIQKKTPLFCLVVIFVSVMLVSAFAVRLSFDEFCEDYFGSPRLTKNTRSTVNLQSVASIQEANLREKREQTRALTRHGCVCAAVHAVITGCCSPSPCNHISSHTFGLREHINLSGSTRRYVRGVGGC